MLTRAKIRGGRMDSSIIPPLREMSLSSVIVPLIGSILPILGTVLVRRLITDHPKLTGKEEKAVLAEIDRLAKAKEAKASTGTGQMKSSAKAPKKPRAPRRAKATKGSAGAFRADRIADNIPIGTKPMSLAQLENLLGIRGSGIMEARR